MAYNRIDSPGHTPMDDEYNPHNNMPLQPYQTNSRSHTPAGQGFQMQEGPFMGSASNNVPYRSTGTPDRLNPQPTYHVENVPNSYGHNEQYMQHYQQYGQQQPYHEGPARIQSPYHDQQQGHPMQEYALNPEQHHDAYYQQPYEPQHGQGHDWNDANTAYDPNGAAYGVHDGYSQGYPTPANEAGQPFYDDADNKPILQADNSFGPNPHQELADQDQDAQLEQARQAMPKDRPIKRWKTVKEVQLFEGNLVLDCPVPPRLLAQVPHAQPPERDEFTHMRYSAATCDPSTFYEDRFTLRQRLFAKPRHTELFIVVTMYNEDEFLFARTMLGIFKNIEHMCGRSSSKTWGKDAWKKIVVCVVSDGRAKINPRTLAVLAGLGVYQDGIAKQQVNGKDVTAHIYEYTTQVGLEIRGEQVALKPRGATPVQILFCLKEKNQKKINSHRWFFQAFGRVLNPNICVLLDAGTKPGRDSIYHLWKAFDLEPMCGGACGEIKVMLSGGKNLVNPLVATQNFEYKMSNILDKPLESAFGFISVLPGAFSAYRYIALQNDKNGQGPLEKYFAGEKLHGANAGIFTANMYLAEDRILCFELVSKRNCRWILQYVKSSTGETDVPDSIAEFILQRRRWLNGSFFAAVYAVAHFYQIGRSDHSFFRKFALGIEFTYQTINMLFAWFAIGNFFLVFRILTVSLGDSNLLGTVGVILGTVFEWLYLAVLLSCFVLALGNRPQGSRKFYMSMVIFWVIIMAYLIFASIFITVKSVEVQLQEKTFTFDDLFQNALFRTLIVSLFSTWVLYLLASIIFFDPWHMVTSFVQYLLLTPTYINILNVYAFCNTHDITWGTKGDDKAAPLPSVHKKDDGKVAVDLPTDDSDLNSQYEKELRLFASKAPKEVRVISASEKQEDYYKGFRSATVLVWILSNLGLAAVVLNTGGLDRVDTTNASQTEAQRSTIYMSVILYSVAGLSLFRFIGACWFLLIRLFRGV